MMAIDPPGSLRATALVVALCASAWPASPSVLLAQGVTTGAVRGTVRAEDGSSVDGARVRVLNAATGFTFESAVRQERFLVQGLDVGGPYVVTIRRVGFVPQQSEPLFVRLGEPLDLHFVLQPVAITVDTLRITAARPFPRANAHGGTATTVSDSLLHRLPTLNRDFYDFVRLVPQISTRIGFASGGLSGGGVGFRFNNFLINGVSERSVGGNVPPAFSGGKSVPLDAVTEYQVLLAPFDVRYGAFAGALVNAVTKSGTNRLHGSVFAYARNDALAGRVGSDARATPYDRLQYGLSLGGPLRRDRAHFFVASELQRLTSPAPGPYVGQPAAAAPPVPVTDADLARLDAIMRGHGLTAGSGGSVENSNPLRSTLARLDLSLPEWNSRAALWVHETRSRARRFERPARDSFPLTTNVQTQEGRGRTTSLQLHTALRRAGGGHNELIASHRSSGGSWLPDVRQPIVRVAVPNPAGGTVTVVSGTPDIAQGIALGDRVTGLQEHLTLPVGASHVVTLGLEVEWFRAYRRGLLNSFGTWTFSSLDSLEGRVAERYEVQRDLGTASVPISGGHYAAYAGDRWRPGERVSITLGVRADLLAVSGRAPYNAIVDSVFDRRTDAMPRRRVHLSPRLGFTWDVLGTGRHQLRGGVGIFTTRPPLAWLQSALYNHGLGIGVLRCGVQPSDLGPPPPFVPDYRAPPTTCADGSGFTAAARDVDLLDADLRMAQTLRGALAYDRRLPGDVLVTVEALGTRNLSDFVFVNLNLREPQAVDRRGRVLYGTIGPTGVANPALRSSFRQVIDLTNTSRNRSYQLSARLEKRFADGFASTASYTYSRVRDVQTPLRIQVPGLTNWSGARAVSGRHDDLSPGISLNDVPHRVVLAGTYRAPWRRWASDVSFHYVGESGGPFTYRAWGGVARRGDLNADGSNANDPIYVPRSALDTSEIRFAQFVRRVETTVDTVTVAEQQAAFEQLVRSAPCLRRQRGRIVERNSCREPWSHTTMASVRQTIPVANHALEMELSAFNVLNLLRRDWGRYRVAAPALLEHVGQTGGAPEAAQPVFRFDPTAPRWTTVPTESAFQLQVALRYRF